MANRYWVGGAGTWDAATTTNWSTTSGGTGGASVPTGIDNVYFDANSNAGSYAVTIANTFVGTASWTTGATESTPFVLTVTAVTSGALAVGNIINSAYGSTLIRIVSFGSGSGGLGTYNCALVRGRNGAGSTNATVYATSAVCQNINISGPASGTLTYVNTNSQAVEVTDSITIGSGSATLTNLNFICTTPTNSYITSNGFTLGYICLCGTGTYGLNGSLTLGSNILYFASGTFLTNDYSLTVSAFNQYSNFNRTIKLGASTVTVTDTGGYPFGAATLSMFGPNVTWDAGTSQVNITSNLAFYIPFGNKTWYNVAFTATTIGNASTGITLGTSSSDNPTFNNLSFAGQTANPNLATLGIQGNITVNGTLSFGASTDATCRYFINSTAIGTTRTLTVNNFAAGATDIDWRDITIAGNAGTISGTRFADCGGNSGIAFATPKTVYWNLVAGGNWNATAWATSSGGTPAVNNFPLAQDTAIIENTGLNSGATINISTSTLNIGTINASTRSTAMTLTYNAATNHHGDLIYSSSSIMSISGFTMTFCGRKTQTITSSGQSFGVNPITINSPGGTVVFADNFTTNNIFTLTFGTINLNGKTITVGQFSSSTSTTRTINFNNGTIVVTGATYNTATNTNLTILGSGIISFTSASGKSFSAGAGDYSNITVSQDGSGTLSINGSSGYKLGKLTNTVSPTTINFQSSLTHSIGNLSLNGTSGNLVTIAPVTAATVYTLKSETGWAHKCSYCAISYATGNLTATDGTPVVWRFTNSTNTAGNTNLTFPTIYYWVGGTGTWDAVTTTNWSLSSGGAGNAGPPTAADNVVFDSNSGTGTVTLSGVPVAYDAIVGGSGWTIAGTVQLSVSGSLTVLSSTTWTMSGQINMIATTKGHLVTTNSVTLNGNNISFNGANGGWTLGSALNLGAFGLRSLIIYQGTFNTNNYNINCGSITIGGFLSYVFSVYLGSSTITVSGVSGSVFLFYLLNNCIFDAGTSTIISNSPGATWSNYQRPLKLYNVVLTTATNTNVGFFDGLSGGSAVNGPSTFSFNNLTINASSTNSVNNITFSRDTVINGTLTFGSTAGITQRYSVTSNLWGTPITLYANAVSGLANVDFRDINAAGPATWSGTNLGNISGNSGITFDAPKTVYYSDSANSTGLNYDNKWATTSGGTPNINNFPLPQDTIIIDNNSLATSASFNFGTCFSFKKIILSNRTNALSITFYYNIISDDLIIPSNVTISNGSYLYLNAVYGSKLSISGSFTNGTNTSVIGFQGLGSIKLISDCTFYQIALFSTLLELNNYTLNTYYVYNLPFGSGFSYNYHSTTRTIDFANNSVINVTGNNNTIWYESQNYNSICALKIKGKSVVNFTYSGSTGTRTIITAASTNFTEVDPNFNIESVAFNFNITAGTDIISLGGNPFYKNLDFTGFSGTLTKTTVTSFIFGDLTLSSGMTFTGITSSTLNFYALSGTQKIKSNGKTFTGSNIIVFGNNVSNGFGQATYQLLDNFTLDNTSTSSCSLNQGTLDLNNNTLTTPIYNNGSFSTVIKILNFGSSGQINLNSAAAASTTIWNCSISNFYTYGNPTVNVTDPGTLGFTKTITNTNSTAPINLNVQAGISGSTVTLTAAGYFNNLDFTGCSSTITNNALSILGSVNLGSTATFTAGTSTWTFTPKELETFTSNGLTVDWPITINAIEPNTGALQLQDNTTIGTTRTLTLTQGTLDLNNKTLNVGLFSSSNSNIRSFAFGNSGILNITATTTSTVFDLTTATNLVPTGSRTINISGAAVSGITRTITTSTVAMNAYFDFNLTGGASGSTITFTTSKAVRNLNFTGTSSTITQVSISITGNLNLGTTATFPAGTNTWTFIGSGNNSITTNGKTVDWPLTMNGSNGFSPVLTLQDSLTMGTTRAFTINTGVLDLNGYTLTAGTMAVNSQGTLPAGYNNVIGGSTSQIILSGTGTVWSWVALTAAVISVPPITITDTSTTARTLALGNAKYQKITIGGTTGTSTTTVTGGGYVGEWASTKTVAHTILFSASSQNSFKKWSITGTAGNVVTIGPATAATAYNFVPNPRVTGVDYLSISYCSVAAYVSTGESTFGAEFYAGANSTDGGGNGNILYFTAAPAATTRYWVGGTGTWDRVSTTNWSTSSGGAGGASIPTSVDTVIFDSASSSGSYTVTINSLGNGFNRNCGNLNVSGPATGNVTITNYTGTYLLCLFGSLNIAATGVIWNFAYPVAFVSTSIGNTITTNGISLSPSTGIATVFDGDGGEWTLGSSFTKTGSGTVYFFKGTFNTANYNVSIPAINSATYSPRTLNWGSSTVTFSGVAGSIWSVTSGSNLTWNSGTSTFNFGSYATINDASVNPTGLTFYNFNFNSPFTNGNIAYYFSGSYTFNNLSFSGTRNLGEIQVQFNNNQTINGTLSFPPEINGSYRFYLQSNYTGIQRTLTINSISNLVDIDFQDIVIAGAVGTISGTRLGDATNNSGITFDAPKTVYLTSNGNWYQNLWATTPTGTPSYSNFPLPQDTVRFDGRDYVIINGYGYLIGTIDLSTNTNPFSFVLSFNSQVFGDVILNNKTTISTASSGTIGFTFNGSNNTSFTSNGSILSYSVTFVINISKKFGISFTLRDAMNVFSNQTTASATVSLNTGILNLNGYNLTTTTFYSSAASTTGVGYNIRTINFNGGAIYLNGGGSTTTQNIWYTNDTNALTILGKPDVYLTFNGGTTSTIRAIVTGNVGPDYNQLVNFYITNGYDTLNVFTGTCLVGNIDFTGFSGKLGAIGVGSILSGNLTLSRTMSLTPGTSSLSIIAAGKQIYLKTNGIIVDAPIAISNLVAYTNTINPPSVTLLDNLTLGPTNGNLTISNYQNFDANGYNVTCLTAIISLVSGYLLKFGTGTWTVTGASFNMGSSAVSTINPGSATILMTSSSAKTFTAPASLTLLPSVCQAGSGALTITGVGTFNDIFASVFPSTISLGAGFSVNNFTLSGRPGALVTLNSTVAATARTLTKVGGGTVSSNYLSIQDSTPSGGTWYAGPNSTRVSNFGIWSAAQAPNSNMMDIV